MCEILDYVDWNAIAQAEPKWYMGYSDNTNMTYLLATLCDTASIYGPCAAAFGMEPWHQSLTDAYELLRGKKQTVCGYELWEKEGKKEGKRKSLIEVIQKMKSLNIEQIPVIGVEGDLVGLVRASDLIKALVE